MRRLLLLVAAGLSLASSLADADEAVERAETLRRAGDAAAAFRLLSPQEAARAGEVPFDYALALAALDSGRPEFASVVLERVLAVDPDFAGARVDLGRAYFLMGAYDAAAEAFAQAGSHNPPPAARAVMARYLEEIRQRRRTDTQVAGYIEVGMGRDTDVNSSTSQSQIPVPALGNLVFTLNPSNIKTADGFAEVAGGVEATRRLDGAWSAYAGADVRYRGHEHAAPFNSGGTDLRTGLSRAAGDVVYRFGLSGGEYTLGRQRNRAYAGVDGELRFRIDAQDMGSIFGQHLRQRFPLPQLAGYAFDQTVVGLAWVRRLDDGKALVSFSAYAGGERATNGRADGDKRMAGIRLGGQSALTENLLIFGNLGWLNGRYQRTNPAFLRTRRDVQPDVTVGLTRLLSPGWSLRGQVTRILNVSNLPLYQYERNVGSVTLRYDFR